MLFSPLLCVSRTAVVVSGFVIDSSYKYSLAVEERGLHEGSWYHRAEIVDHFTRDSSPWREL